MDLGDKLIATILEEVKQNRLKLPTLPEVAVKVRKAVDDANTSAAQIAKILTSDAALSARLIQVANSPMYRGNSAVEHVQGAVARLGNSQVRSLVTSLIMKQLFETRSPELKKRMQRLWMHSTEVAAISHALARRFTRLNPEEAMLAGLIHDIGALPILVLAEQMPELVQNDGLLDDVVRKIHGPLGRIILDAWKFPQQLVAVTSQHEDLSYRSAGDTDFVDVVIVANLHSYLGTDHPLAKTRFADVPAFAKLGLKPEESLAALEEARNEMQETRRLLAA